MGRSSRRLNWSRGYSAAYELLDAAYQLRLSRHLVIWVANSILLPLHRSESMLVQRSGTLSRCRPLYSLLCPGAALHAWSSRVISSPSTVKLHNLNTIRNHGPGRGSFTFGSIYHFTYSAQGLLCSMILDYTPFPYLMFRTTTEPQLWPPAPWNTASIVRNSDIQNKSSNPITLLRQRPSPVLPTRPFHPHHTMQPVPSYWL